ncbi:hypothetical protein RJ639_007261 [Escallonia herrerae]|uniref:Uncharacterized protein n=1 Tax=Escallonia herrerae TaxID=1293975 RepID=A0AA89AVH1_9ASTE|nr:hypothetical protein RJ639_007261 [Escallonia herrerae]
MRGYGTKNKPTRFQTWYNPKSSFPLVSRKIKKRRDFIKNYVQKNMRISSGVEGIARREIQKRIDLVQVIIYMGFAKLLIESRPRGIEEL